MSRHQRPLVETGFVIFPIKMARSLKRSGMVFAWVFLQVYGEEREDYQPT